jgi:hypothetical protein
MLTVRLNDKAVSLTELYKTQRNVGSLLAVLKVMCDNFITYSLLIKLPYYIL